MLTDDEFRAHLAGFTHSAYRLEVQPAYPAGHAGGVPQARSDWSRRVAEHTRQGRFVVRIRVHDDPPTDDGAGEVVGHVTRARAYEIGLLPAAGDRDWWLLDEARLLVTAYDGDRLRARVSTDPDELERARRCWDLAVRAVREDAGSS